MLMITAIAFVGMASDLPVVEINRDNIIISESCRVRVTRSPIVDAEGNGVVQIVGSDITVEFAEDSPGLRGAYDDQLPDSYAGKGIVITGRDVALVGGGAKVSGYKVGIHAIKADGFTLSACDVSDNFAQRLKSTPAAEDSSDWLWPHANDHNEWINNYGAGVCIEDSDMVTVRDIRARRTQNGIILDRVNDSKVYDCDCSFLSGWGLAMWRSSRNVISRNAFDFCVRGYSHGVYNRGQDSAGILMFEQCSDNIIAENSATHGGDGLFAFAGKEALGEVNAQPSPSAYKHRGNDRNTFHRNDFSFAAAHGLELTFSFQNRISENVFRGNAICGIWGGYSQATLIDNNIFADNGEGAYGLERGGINIEHGRYNLITRNRFEGDKCGVHLWWDEDEQLMASIWARANEPLSSNNFIVENEFARLPLAIQLRETTLTNIASNSFDEVAEPLQADAASTTDIDARPAVDVSNLIPVATEPLGESKPLGARSRLAGRANIIMTEWGPWDHQSPLLQFVKHFDEADEYRLRGADVMPDQDAIDVEGEAIALVRGDRIGVLAKQPDTLTPYRISFDVNGRRVHASGVVTGGSWKVMAFASSVDPRTDEQRWREEGSAAAKKLLADKLDLRFGSGGIGDALDMPVQIPADHFGTIASRTLTVPAGSWRIKTLSDDGIRVWMNDRLVIDDWTHHAPRTHNHDFTLDQPTTIDFRVEHFELDGHAVLRVEIVPAD